MHKNEMLVTGYIVGGKHGKQWENDAMMIVFVGRGPRQWLLRGILVPVNGAQHKPVKGTGSVDSPLATFVMGPTRAQ